MQAPPTIIVPVTIRAEREFASTPEELFAAYAEINQRVRWIRPFGQPIEFESHDFRSAGLDHFTSGPRGNAALSTTTRYEHIVDNQSIVFTNRLESSSEELVAISLVSWSIAPSKTGTLLAIADQTTSVAGSRPIEGARHRYEAMFDRLAHHLIDSAGE